MLYIGADDFPFPIPLGKNPSGRWYFDTAAGKDEILARRIGKGGLTAIAACGATADAQLQYFSQTHDGDKVKQYAQKFVSDAGKHNGLYWSVPEGQAPSPLGLLGDFAKAAGYTSAGSKPQPFNGYYFRILTRQGDKAKGGAKVQPGRRLEFRRRYRSDQSISGMALKACLASKSTAMSSRLGALAGQKLVTA